MVNGCVYVGQTVDLSKRFKQYRARPPKRMQADAAAFKPFDHNFMMHTLETCDSKAAADAAERRHIHLLQSRGTKGYNTLRGNPASTRQYWFLRRRNILVG